MYTTIITLYKQGNSQRKIARLTNTDRKTVKRIITRFVENGTEYPVSCVKPSDLDHWHKKIVGLLEKSLSNVRIFEELVNQGFTRSYPGLCHYIRRHKIRDSSCIRFHTAAGEEAQVWTVINF